MHRRPTTADFLSRSNNDIRVLLQLFDAFDCPQPLRPDNEFVATLREGGLVTADLHQRQGTEDKIGDGNTPGGRIACRVVERMQASKNRLSFLKGDHPECGPEHLNTLRRGCERSHLELGDDAHHRCSSVGGADELLRDVVQKQPGFAFSLSGLRRDSACGFRPRGRSDGIGLPRQDRDCDRTSDTCDHGGPIGPRAPGCLHRAKLDHRYASRDLILSAHRIALDAPALAGGPAA